jgi:hypothetical protein
MRGVKGSGKPKNKPTITPGDTASGAIPVKKTRRPRRLKSVSTPHNVFGDDGKILTQMQAQADLARILQKHLFALSVDLDKLDNRIGIPFGKRVMDKIRQAGLDAVVKLDFTTISKPHKNILSSIEDKKGGIGD